MPSDARAPGADRPDAWRSRRRIRDRLQRVHGLHLRGLNTATIADRLGVSPRTVARDLDRLHTLWLEQRHDFAERERLRSLGVVREFDRLLWPLLDRHRTDEQAADVARLLRVFLAGQREIRLLLNAADPPPRRPPPLLPSGPEPPQPLTVSALMAELTAEQINAVTPEQIAAWDAESERDALERERRAAISAASVPTSPSPSVPDGEGLS